MMQIVHYHGHTQPGEPTVRLERLEDEMSRYGRVIPTNSGSYVINPLCKLKRQTSSDDMPSSMNIGDVNVTQNDGETDCMHLKKSKKNFEHSSEVGMKTVVSDVVLATSAVWPPLYEDISDSETESQNNTELKCSAQMVCEFVCNKDNMETVSLNRENCSNMNVPINPESYIPDIISQPKAILTEDVVVGKTGGKRRYSAPENLSEHGEKKKKKQRKGRRRWSFNSEADVREKRYRWSYLKRLTIERQLDEEYRIYIKLSSSEDESFEDNEDDVNLSMSIKKEPPSIEDDAENETNSTEMKTGSDDGVKDEDAIVAPDDNSTVLTEKTVPHSSETTKCLSKDTDLSSPQDNGSFNSKSSKSKTSILKRNKYYKNKARKPDSNPRMDSQDISYSKFKNNSKGGDLSSTANNKNLKEHASKFPPGETGEEDSNKNQEYVSSGVEKFEVKEEEEEEGDLLKTAVTKQNTETLKKTECTEPVIVLYDSKSKGNEVSSDSDFFSNKSISRANSNAKCTKHKINSNSSESACDDSSDIILEITSESTETSNVHKHPKKSNFENDVTGRISNDLSTAEDKPKKEDIKPNAHSKIKTNEVKATTDIKKELSNIREKRKRHFSRHPRFSRHRFRHDDIEMFKISPDMPSHSKHKELNIQHESSSSSSQVNVDATVVVDIEDDAPSPGCLTIDLDEPNVKDSDTLGESKEDINKNDEVIVVHEVKTSKDRKLSTEVAATSCESNKKASETDEDKVVNEEPDNESKEKDSETSDEGQNKKKKKKVRKRISGDPSVVEEVMNQIFSNQMQEKGRRLAQELPGFNWLEEKIRNGGVSKLSQKRPSTQDTLETTSSPIPETSKSSILCQSGSAMQSTRMHSKLVVSKSSDLSKSSGNDLPSDTVSTENRDGVRPPSKKPRQISPEAESQEAIRNAVSSPTDEPAKQVPLLQQPQRTPEETPVSETDQYVKVSRKPVIVTAAEVAETPVVDPLLKQLTSGGELEVTLSMPHCSLSLSDSKVRTTAGNVADSDFTYVSVEPVKPSLKPQENCYDRQGLPGNKNQPTRMSCGVENLPQPHVPRGNEMHHHYGPGRDHHQWQNDGPVRTWPEASQVLPPNPQTERGYSDRIATMARHAAVSFDTGLVGPAAVLEAAHRAQRRQFQRPPESQQTTDQPEPFTPQMTGYDPRFQYPRSYSVYGPQQSVRPQIVRPSAHYPPMPPYRPQPAYIQAQAGSNRPCQIPGVPQYPYVQHAGTVPVHQKPVPGPTRPVINSSNVQQMINKGPCSPPNEVPSQGAGYSNVGVDPSANKASQDLEMELLMKLKQAREEEVHRLNLKKEEAMRALQEANKQIECLQQTDKPKELSPTIAGQVHPRPAVTAAAAGNLLSSVPHQRQEELHMPNRGSHVQYQGQDSNSSIESHGRRHETGEPVPTQHKFNAGQRTAGFHHNSHPSSNHQRQGLAQIPNITGSCVNSLEIPATTGDHSKPSVPSEIRNIGPPLQAVPHQKSKVMLGVLPNVQLSQFSPGHEPVRGTGNGVKLPCQQMSDAAVGQFTEDEAASRMHEPHSHNKQQIPPPPTLFPRPPLTTAQSFPSQLYHSASDHASHHNTPQLSPTHKTNPPQPEVKQQQPHGKSHLLRSSLQLPARQTTRNLQTHALPGAQQHQSLSPSHYQQRNMTHVDPSSTEQSNSVNAPKPGFHFNAMPPPPPLKPDPHRPEEAALRARKFALPHLPHTKFSSSTSQESKSAPSIVNEDHPIDLSFSKHKSASNQNSPTGESGTSSIYCPENASRVPITAEHNSPKLFETLQTDMRRMYPVPQEHLGLYNQPVLSHQIQNRVNPPHKIPTTNIIGRDKKSTAHQRQQLNRHEEADSSTPNNGTSHCSQLPYYTQGYMQHVPQPQQLMHMSVTSSSSSPDYQQRQSTGRYIV